MQVKKILTSLVLLTLTQSGLWAQSKQEKDSTLGNQTIIIHQVYEPEVKQPTKPNLVPTLPAPDTTTPHYKYVVPQQVLTYSYHSIPIRPLALGKQPEEKSFPGYVKFGLGNRSTLYADAGYAGLKGANYETFFHVSHLNQKGKIKDQKASYTTANAGVKYFTDNNEIGAKLDFRNRRYRFYAPEIILPPTFNNSLKNNLTEGRLTLDLGKRNPSLTGLNYHPEIHFGLAGYGNTNKAHETEIGFNLPFSYGVGAHPDQISKVRLNFEVLGNFIRYKNPSINSWNNLIEFAPSVDFNFREFQIHLGLTPAVSGGAMNTKGHLLGDLYAKTGLLNDKLKITAGWKSEILQNSFLDLSLINPYLAPNSFLQIQPTRADQVFVSGTSTAGQFVTFGATLSWRHWKNLPLFINDYLGEFNGRSFGVLQTNVDAINLEAFIRYQPTNVIALSAKGSYMGYYKPKHHETWGYPTTKFEGLVETHFTKSLFAHLGLIYMGGIHTLDIHGNNKKLENIVDLHLSAEYNIIKRLSVFAEINNLLNRKYQRWNLYEVNGFNLLGGLRLNF